MGNKRPPIVSVVIPCYNYGRYVEEAVDSCLRSTLKSIEIIVVNDGSTDPYTIRVLNRLQKPKTRVIHQPNRGVSAARNNGIRHAKGRYILTLDADDKIHPTYLAKAVILCEFPKHRSQQPTNPTFGRVCKNGLRFGIPKSGVEAGRWIQRKNERL